MEKINLKNILDYYKCSLEFGDAKALRKILFFMKSEGCKFAYKRLVYDVQYSEECRLLKKPEKPLVRFDFLKDENVNSENYLGYIQIRPCNKDWPINDAFLKAPSANLHPLSYFITCNAQYIVEHPISSMPFKISGTFFAQRDDHLGKCAHSCLRMLSYHYNSLLTIPKIKEIADEKNLASNGLEIESHVIKVLNNLGLYHIPYNPPFDINIETPTGDKELAFTIENIIYTYVESSMPVLVVLETKRSPHMILVIGHTFDPHAWWPEAHERYYQKLPQGRYLKSSSWVNFICHDDNFGPFLSFPREIPIESNSIYKEGEKFDTGIYTIIVPSPKPLLLGAEIINPLIYGMFRDDIIKNHIRSIKSIWSDCFLRHLEEGKLLLRSFLITKDDFLERIKNSKNRMSKRVKDFYQKQEMFIPLDRFWITEISVPEIFSQERYCLGEIITDPQPPFTIELKNVYYLEIEKINQIVKSIHVIGILITYHEGKPRALRIEDDMPYNLTIRY